jgi:hypothetical protein
MADTNMSAEEKGMLQRLHEKFHITCDSDWWHKFDEQPELFNPEDDEQYAQISQSYVNLYQENRVEPRPPPQEILVNARRMVMRRLTFGRINIRDTVSFGHWKIDCSLPRGVKSAEHLIMPNMDERKAMEAAKQAWGFKDWSSLTSHF